MEHANVGGSKTPRYKELAIPRSKIDSNSNTEAFKVKRGALSYEITDSLNKLARPKRVLDPGTYDELHVSPKKGHQSKIERGCREAPNLVQKKKVLHHSERQKSTLDTYARIVATNNKRCSKRLRDLSKPKKNFADAVLKNVL